MNEPLFKIRYSKALVQTVWAIALVPLIALGYFIAERRPNFVDFSDWDFIRIAFAFVLLIPVHEALHGLAVRVFTDLSWADISFGFSRKTFTFYCHPKKGIPVGAHKRVLLTPVLVTGAALLATIYWFPKAWLAVAFAMAVGVSGSDFAVFWKLRKIPNHLIVKDSPTESGCDVYERDETPCDPNAGAGNANEGDDDQATGPAEKEEED